MRILMTGATSNVGRGLIARLQAAGHDLVLSDLVKPAETYAKLPFVQCDVQQGFGLERAAAGCQMVIHLPAWHGIHWNQKTEVDYWRLNVDGTFYALQAAQSAGIKRFVFLSSQAWHGHYDKYGFTKRIGEELCEYNRTNHGMRYIAIRPHDFTPWWNFTAGYGARLLYGGVDREDVMDCIQCCIDKLVPDLSTGQVPEGFAVNAVRANAFSVEQVANWEQDPLSHCERLFPGSRSLVEKYQIPITRKPELVEHEHSALIVGYHAKRHFGTFIEELRRLDQTLGHDAVVAMKCPY